MNTPTSVASEDRYSPPQAVLEHHVAPMGLASRWQRTLGLLIDSVLSMLPGIPIYMNASMQQIATAQGRHMWAIYTDFGIWGWTGGALSAVLALTTWFLITTRGQSIGKIVVGSRIVRVDGTSVGFLNGVVLRHWVLVGPALALATLVPGGAWIMQLFGFLNLINLGMGIFRADRRCLHDFLADTRVIKA